ncbi:unnamed protein product [Ectocarpus sp. CCAP 1310/34]|nr:unnamed protein product [Ectocarpus sp. CCAP 1310/34]
MTVTTPAPTADVTTPPTAVTTPAPTAYVTTPPTRAGGTMLPTSEFASTLAPSIAAVIQTPGLGRTASPEAVSIGERGFTAAPTMAPTLVAEVQEVAVSAASVMSTASVVGVMTSTVVTVLGGASSSMVAGGTAQAATQSTCRSPSATMAFVLTSQIQFLATLSFVDTTGAEESAFSDLTNNLRWVNLWPSESFSEGIASRIISDEPDQPSDEDDTTPSAISQTVTSNVGSLLFMGNLALFSGLLVIIFTSHVLVASVVEAYWVAKQRARKVISRSLRRGLSLSEIPIALSGTWSQQPTMDDGSSAGSQSSGIMQSPQRMERQAVSPYDGGDSKSDEEEGGPRNTRPGNSIGQVSDCRELSQSPWLHYPHLELIFLFFAFEGAVTSQMAALRSANSSTILYAAVATLVLYPLLMVVMVARTHRVWVQPDALIVFASSETEEALAGKPSTLSRTVSGLKNDFSLFSWADKGQWETVQTANDKARRKADWFRIGFEPLFADFTQAGSWFIIYTLIECAVLASIAVLVDNSAMQFLLFCAMHSLTFVLLVGWKPFANSVLNAVAAMVMLTDAVCMGMLALAAGTFNGTATAARMDTAVMVIQALCIAVLVIPLYVDTAVSIYGMIRNRKGSVDERENEADRAEREVTKRLTLRLWGRAWFRMVFSNMFACLRDTREGIRGPTHSARQGRLRTGRIGPFPDWLKRRTH